MERDLDDIIRVPSRPSDFWESIKEVRPCHHVSSGEVQDQVIEETELPSDSLAQVRECPVCGHRWRFYFEG